MSEHDRRTGRGARAGADAPHPRSHRPTPTGLVGLATGVRLATRAALATCLCLAAPTAALAQDTGSIAGSVTAADGSGPVVGAHVRAAASAGEDPLRATLSDGRGRFVLSDLPPGEVTVTVERIGLRRISRTVQVEPGRTAEVAWQLEAEALPVAGITVSATRRAQRISETAAAIGVVDAQELQETRAAHPAEVMGRIPGVHVNVTGGEGHMAAIRQPITTDPVYLYLEDGVPTRSTGFFNHNALYEVNLAGAGGVEVIRGPGTAVYGSDAIGGVVNVRTRPAAEAPEAELAAEAGDFGWLRLLASASGSGDRDGLRADLNLTTSDGWRNATAYERQSGTLRWDRSLSGRGSLRTVAAFSRIEQETAGTSPLPEEVFREAPDRNLTPISFRSVRAFRLSSEWERMAGDMLLSVTPFVRYNRMDLLPDWALTFDPAVWETENRSLGLMARLHTDVGAWQSRLVAGIDLDYSPGSRFERAITPTREDGVFVDYEPGEVLYDYEVTFAQAAPYLQLMASPSPRLRLSAGLRADLLSYRYDSALEPLQEGSHRRPADTSVGYGHLSPKVGATFDATGSLNLFASYRHGFRVPSEGQLFRQGSALNTVGLEPVKANSFEVGLRGRVGEALTYELTGYYMPKDDDIVGFTRPDGVRETRNAGRTLHRGIEAGIDVRVAPGVNLNMAYTRARHTYEEWRPEEGLDFAGNGMEAAPEGSGTGELVVRPGWPADSRFALEWVRVGRYWMDPANTERYGGHDLLNLRASVPLPGGLALTARAMNLTDEVFAEHARYSQFRGAEFAPGRPRALFVSLEWNGGLR